MSSVEILQITQKLTSSGLFPPKNVNILRWDITADNWGVLIAEAATASDMANILNMWRGAGAGFFKSTKTSPAQTADEAIANTVELLRVLGSS
ncbi:MAG: hypothetical protein EXR62_17520 [Chloroflexi bacterium]|nr:hypothetical protein [Chloroflexota bacterium]